MQEWMTMLPLLILKRDFFATFLSHINCHIMWYYMLNSSNMELFSLSLDAQILKFYWVLVLGIPFQNCSLLSSKLLIT